MTDSEYLGLRVMMKNGWRDTPGRGPEVSALGDAIRAELAGLPGFEIPWQVRYARWWWRREARYHANASSHGLYDRKWHLGQMREAVRYARNVVPFWRASGNVPWVAVRCRAEAEGRMSGAVPYPEPRIATTTLRAPASHADCDCTSCRPWTY